MQELAQDYKTIHEDEMGKGSRDRLLFIFREFSPCPVSCLKAWHKMKKMAPFPQQT